MEVILSCVGTTITCLDSQSMTTKIAVKPNEGGNCLMKSIDIEFHIFSGIGRCQRLLYGWCQGALDLAQFPQDSQWPGMNRQTPGHAQFHQTRFNVFF